MEGKTALGASSPAKPALHIPDPLSITKALTSSSIFVVAYCVYLEEKLLNIKTMQVESRLRMDKDNY